MASESLLIRGLLAEDARQARDEFFARYADLSRRGLKNRFPPREVPREAFEHEAGPRGAIYAGDAREAIVKIRWEREVLGIRRLLLQVDWGGMPFEEVKRSIEILGTEVAPVVREEYGAGLR